MSEQEITTQILIINYEAVIRDLKQDIGWDEEVMSDVIEVLQFRMNELKEVWLDGNGEAIPEADQ